MKLLMSMFVARICVISMIGDISIANIAPGLNLSKYTSKISP